MLSDGQQVELAFWKGEIEKYPGEDYAAIQAANLPGKMKHFPEYRELAGKGKGLDLGCGPTSIFEGSLLTQQSAVMYAVDPLMEHYQQLYTPENPTVKYVTGYQDGGPLPFGNGAFDYIFCINVIDHTEHWQNLLVEMRRVLRECGKLFFMVNFDHYLTPPNHTRLWDWGLVQREIGLWPERQTVVWSYDHQKYAYWGVFVKAC